MTTTGLSPTTAYLSRKFVFFFIFLMSVLQPQARRNKLGLGSFAFARHYLRNHNCFLFLRLLRCFSSPGSPFCLKQKSFSFTKGGFPIRKSADQFVMTNPRSLSQSTTSFIASERQGILHTLLNNFLYVFVV